MELEVISRIQRFARAMSPSVPSVETALPALLELLRAAGRPFRIVGGLAVIHHGYVRATCDIDVLVTREHGLDPRLAGFGFERVGPARLKHRSGTPIDLLIAGTPSPRTGEAPWPEPSTISSSPDAPEVVSLEGLIALKLAARRAQDRADLVALLKKMPEGRYLEVDASLPPERRKSLFNLREEALEERAMEE